ncbi:hypothetical protein F5888DRAFT_1632839 [Russula emetica]|nr:hypothetical protein F5888DRAFT_1632839 [Russula emetica]
MSDPSIIVAEAFKQFSQVTVSALRAYEHGTRARLTQAEDDLRVLRHERDDSLRDLNACKEQSRAWLTEVNRWKAEARPALFWALLYYSRQHSSHPIEDVLSLGNTLTDFPSSSSPSPPHYTTQNKHQAELIAQLRQEAQQWKDQCLRLEESLRGEIKSWKDQFLRIDAERTRLLDQLQLSSSSQTTLMAHTPKHVPILAGDSSATSSSTKRCASASSSTFRADKFHSPTKAIPFPRVVRRVQAVIDVPVKVEEEEEDVEEANRVDWPDFTVLLPTSTPTGGINGGARGTGGHGRAGGSAKRRKSSASSRSMIFVPPSDDEERRSLVDGEEPPSEDEEEVEEGNDGSGEYVDEEEVENAIVNGTPSAAAAATMTGGGGGQKAGFPIPWGRKHVGHQPDEEDDELMMYAKDNPHKVRPSHENHHHHRDRPWIPPRRKSNTDVTAQQQRLSATTTNNVPAPKRRTTEMGPGGSLARTKRRR